MPSHQRAKARDPNARPAKGGTASRKPALARAAAALGLGRGAGKPRAAGKARKAPKPAAAAARPEQGMSPPARVLARALALAPVRPSRLRRAARLPEGHAWEHAEHEHRDPRLVAGGIRRMPGRMQPVNYGADRVRRVARLDVPGNWFRRAAHPGAA